MLSDMGQSSPTSTEVKVEELVDSLIRRTSKRFKCQRCLKYFSSKHCLKEHGYTHTNERPYSCRVCLKTFKHASQFSLHKKVHVVRTEISWPKLTEMLLCAKTKTEKIEISAEKIDLPLIECPQEFKLPKFNF